MPKKYLKKLKINLVKGEYKNPAKGQVRDPEQVYQVFKSMKDDAQETLLGVYLDKDLEIKIYDVLSTGGESETMILPHEIFRHAIVLGAKYFILIHNHPSGNSKPSENDKYWMAEIQRQAKILKLKFLDSIIIGDVKSKDEKEEKSYWSMFEELDGGEYALGEIDFENGLKHGK